MQGGLIICGGYAHANPIIISSVMRTLLVLLAVSAICSGFELFNLQYLSQKNGASCLDGSPPGLFTYIPDP